MTRRGFLGGLAALSAMPLVSKAKAEGQKAWPAYEGASWFKESRIASPNVLAAFDAWIDYQVSITGTYPVAVPLHPDLFAQVRDSLLPLPLPGLTESQYFYRGINVRPDPAGLTSF